MKEKGTKVRLKFGYEDLDAARKISSAFTSLDIEQPKLHFDDFATSSIFPSETPKTERKHKKLDDNYFYLRWTALERAIYACKWDS